MRVGSHHSQATKEKLRNIFKGRRLLEETKLKMSQSRIGSLHSQYGKHISEERKNRQRESIKRFYATEKGMAMRVHLSQTSSGNHSHLGHPHSAEDRAKMSKIKQGKVLSEETRMKMSETGKALWQMSSHRNKLVKASREGMVVHPNKPEVMVLNMLNAIAPNEWAFVGDGQVVIEGKIPDFIQVNGCKQIIEVFGDYWHGKKARCYEETEEGRIALFKKYGYSTLVVWEKELKDPDKVLAKICAFIRK